MMKDDEKIMKNENDNDNDDTDNNNDDWIELNEFIMVL